MSRPVLAALLLAGCAVGHVSADGAVTGVALGQARLDSCAPEVAPEAVLHAQIIQQVAERMDLPAPPVRCSEIAGGALSDNGGKAVGLLGGLIQLVLGGL